MGFDDSCNTGLVLGLSLTSKSNNIVTNQTPPKKSPCSSSSLKLDDYDQTEPSLTLSLSGDQGYIVGTPSSKKNIIDVINNRSVGYNYICGDHQESGGDRQASPPPSALSNSFSSGRVAVKRERDLSSEECVELERVSSRVISDEDEDGVNARKKLRLTKEQSALLEDSFKQHSTLNPKQKQVLARQLHLRPRQVEVWFQNRRARTKLKQTEVDCEFLKKCCETLTDENRRLQKELQELKALKLAQPFYMHMPAATLTMCPSCERIGTGVRIGDSNAKSPFSMAPKPHLFTPFTNPSAAC